MDSIIIYKISVPQSHLIIFPVQNILSASKKPKIIVSYSRIKGYVWL